MKRCPIIGLNMSMPDSDSFSIGTNYTDAIEDAGGLPLCLPSYGKRKNLLELLDVVDGFLFIGGKDYFPKHYGGRQQPQSELMEARRDSFDLHLAGIVLEKTKLPVLGICGGAQLINITLGGALVQDIDSDWQALTGKNPSGHHGGTSHIVSVERDSLLFSITGQEKMRTNSFHHQAVCPQRLGRGLKVTAKSDDGVVEAIEPIAWQKRFLLGLQWHPERMFQKDAVQKRIFKSFIQAAIAHKSAERR